jgi:phosphoribosyl 1,2-cyclic phosphodiesterase
MKLTVLGSSSSGNCYILDNDNECIIIEIGKNITMPKLKQALKFNISKVKGVLISHLHDDHAGMAKECEKIFPVYCNHSVIEAKDLQRAIEIKHGKKFEIGGFIVLPFDAEHDVPCLGFIIKHKEIGNLLFLTDSGSCDYEFKHLNHILIECNYSDEALAKSIENGLHPSVAKRVLGTHLELYACRDVLLQQDLSNVYNIILIHLSQNNSDEKQFKEVLSRATGKPIQIAKQGLKIELMNKPY